MGKFVNYDKRNLNIVNNMKNLSVVIMILVEVPMVNGLGKTKGCEDAPCIFSSNLSKIGKKRSFSIS
jgi:hypothetical protein